MTDYADGWHAEASLASYFRLYNEERIHQSLGYRTPAEVYQSRGSSDGPPSDEKRIEIARNKLIAG
jgi:transposase InsO family protein